MNIYQKSGTFVLILSLFITILIPVSVYADAGDLISTVEIDDATLNGPVLTDYDAWGFSVTGIGDLNGDGVDDVVSGAPFDDNGGTDRGAIHIMFMNIDGTIDSTVEINDGTANGPVLTDEDYFGASVANIGDLNNDGVDDLAVGAYLDDNGGSGRGAVHIMFMNTNGSVDSTVEINDGTTNGPVLANLDQFGYSVTSIGDLNGDGVDDLAVGANGDNGSGSDRGALHIMFMNTNGSVDSTVEINDGTTNGPVLVSSDQFGYSVAGLGDLNGDGVNDIAVGAPFDSNGGSERGAVHIMFMNTDGTIDSTVEINDGTANGPDLSNSDYFGTSIANIGDLDKDGVDDIAVGAYADDAGGTDRGAVHIIFMNTDGTVDSVVEVSDSSLNGPALSDVDQFGSSVANIGDIDGNGEDDIAVGSAGDSGAGDYKGSVHIVFFEEVEASSIQGGNAPSITLDAKCSVSSRAVTKDELVTVGMYVKVSNKPSKIEWLNYLQGDAASVTHQFSEEGDYIIKAKVSDGIKNSKIIDCPKISVRGEFVAPPVVVSPEDALAKLIGVTFGRDLKYKNIGEDVRLLQKLLNSINFKIAEQGPGSPGNESTYYGLFTQSAVSKFQTALKLPVTGDADQRTRGMLDFVQALKRLGIF